MRIAISILSLATVLSITACSHSVDVNDKAYFAEHPAERAQVLSACRADPGHLEPTPNCVNAIAADGDAEHQRVFHGRAPKVPGVNDSSHL